MFIKKKRTDKLLTRYDTNSMNTNSDLGKLHKLPQYIDIYNERLITKINNVKERV